MLTYKPFKVLRQKGRKTNRTIQKLVPSRVSLRVAGDETLSTCNSNDQRNRERVGVDLYCQTFNEQDQVVAVGEPLVHVTTLLFILSLFLLHRPPSSLFLSTSRLRVYIQNLTVCTGNASACSNTCGHVAGTRGDVLNVHTEA